MVEELGNLPEGWIDTNLGSVTEYGKASKKTIADVDAATWILELEDIEKETTKLIARVNVKERPFKSTKNIFKKGDVLYGKLRPYLNKLMLADADGVCTTEIIPIDARPFCINKYIFYWLRNSIFLSYVNEVSYGVNMPRLGTSDGNNAPFRLAPYYEQKVIAEKLDLLLAQVDSIKTRLDQIPQILKRFRQAVLSAAVSGELTRSSVSERVLQPLGNTGLVIKTGPFGSALHKSDYIMDGVPIINPMHINDGIITASETMTVSDAKYLELETWALKDGDVIVGRRGEMGRAAVVVTNGHKMLCGTGSMILRVPSKAIPKYLELILRSPVAISYFNSESVGSTMVNLNQKVINALKVFYPPLEEQTEIVTRVEKLFAWADNIEKQVAEAQKRVNNLTQSILAKAFRGELTEQWRKDNPDLISGENSAAALLERIKAERAAQTKKPKKKV